jgi:type II secretory pathway component PulM
MYPLDCTEGMRKLVTARRVREQGMMMRQGAVLCTLCMWMLIRPGARLNTQVYG